MQNQVEHAPIVANLLEAKDAELTNASLVSTLVFTVAAAGILAPSGLSIDGKHTDLYGSLCVISLLSCLSSVLSATILKKHQRLPSGSGHGGREPGLLMHFVARSEVFRFFLLPITSMWIGATAITGALGVTTFQAQALCHRRDFEEDPEELGLLEAIAAITCPAPTYSWGVSRVLGPARLLRAE